MLAAWNAIDGFALTSVRRLRATHPQRPESIDTLTLSSRTASSPAANPHFSAWLSWLYRNSAQPDQGTIFVSFDEMISIVSATPRPALIAWAISYNALISR